MIDGVKTKKLKVIPDERGRLMEILRSDDELFSKFGQVYITTVYPGVVKAWHYHKKQIDNIAVIKGMAKVVLYDNRENSPTKGEINEFFIGEHNPILICVPKLVLHGFKGISECEAIMLNCPTEVYNYQSPDEFRVPAYTKEIPYNWEREDK
ncbi:MAG: dTDP-4-dehydrorhamnose 3,5-epimerase family protein [candidate division Zixibacteria bacterium]|nr:dTDP-4-dehydrorhamnose 3,5-epimerase family protein [candidate division Zixibacteria bacterium]